MAEEERIEDRIKRMIVERLFLQIDPARIDDAASLTKSLEVDSVRLFEIVIGLEEMFGVTFADDEFSVQTFDTVGAIAQSVRAKLAGGAAG